MTEKTKQEIRAILEDDRYYEEHRLQAIVDVVDKALAEALIKSMEFGPLLEACGLEITSKKDTQ
jgi:hypothetical protein